MKIANGLGLVGACLLMAGCSMWPFRPKEPPTPTPVAPAPVMTELPPSIPTPTASAPVQQNAPPVKPTPAPSPAPVPALAPVAPVAEASAPSKPVIKPDLRSWGNVMKINSDARFVILAFEPGAMPSPGQHLNVYRNGAKVGVVAITGPQQDNDTVADIVSGDIQIHDEARAD
jgi:hypothetical protein